ncbi:MAG TPA: DbpA RNA binding domain-containing protein, partial [Chloroflexia bacterium]|nr:DbpA RNA binding domain-containing protein [Chloroflexia bacterium]
GRATGVRPGDIVGAIANEAGIPGRSIGAIDIYDRATFVEVPAADRERVVRALARTTIKGQRLQVEVVGPTTPRPPTGPAPAGAPRFAPRPAGRPGAPEHAAGHHRATHKAHSPHKKSR